MQKLSKKDKYNIGIIGATGLVGRSLIKELEKVKLNIDNLYLFGSKKSVNKKITFKNKTYYVYEFTKEYYDFIDIFFFCSTNEISRMHIPFLLNKPCLIIDNSSEFRLIDNVPLVIPKLNFQIAKNKKLICNPNCSTIQSVMILGIIDKFYNLKKIIYNTYQAVSGSGIDGIIDYYHNKRKVYYYNIKDTCIPVIGRLAKNNRTTEEEKMILETKKILKKNITIDATCIRVPILIGHGVSVYIETKKKINIDDIKEKLSKYSNIVILDDVKNNIYPTSINTFDNSKIYMYNSEARKYYRWFYQGEPIDFNIDNGNGDEKVIKKLLSNGQIYELSREDVLFPTYLEKVASKIKGLSGRSIIEFPAQSKRKYVNIYFGTTDIIEIHTIRKATEDMYNDIERYK